MRIILTSYYSKWRSKDSIRNHYLLSIFIHFLILLSISETNVRPFRNIKNNTRNSVKITYSPKLTKKLILKSTKPPVKISSDQKRKTRVNKKANFDNLISQSKYNDYLPGPEQAFIPDYGIKKNEGHSLGTGRGAHFGAEFLVESFDVPLIIRQLQSAGVAIGKVTRGRNGDLIANYVQGQPVLRAILFEAMRDKRNHQPLNRILNESGFKSLRFKLCIKTSDQANIGHVTKIEITGNLITITRFFSKSKKKNISIGFMGSPPTGTNEPILSSVFIPVPDEEAERAIRRDKTKLRRLRRSPANTAPIKNRKLY